MPKIRLETNVYEEAIKRINFTFDNFEKVYLSFSGGKDSTVMLHMVMDEAIKRNRKIAIMIVDLEGQYKLTIEHMKECINMYSNYIDLNWVCLPIHLRNAVSVFEPFWLCWDSEKKEDWIRQPPKNAIIDIEHYPFFRVGMEFEEFVPEFGEWYSEGKTCACLVGIRADESLNRFRTIASKSKVTFKDKQWTTKVTDNVFNVYPIYDWAVEDIWIYHGKFKNKRHNHLYDLMHKAGLSISLQRICQPYGDDQRRGLWLFHLIEPETWAKVVARVNGANSGALYVQDTGNINGYGKITKPQNHTWKSFSELILNTLPEKTSEHYKNKIYVFDKWWKERGYKQGLPDQAPSILESQKLAPSWRRVCKSLLRNDFWCKGLGFTQHKTKAYEKYLKLKKEQRETNKFNL
jgi:predicted phosphoadenosine phosphosulfate sulfurtransferase